MRKLLTTIALIAAPCSLGAQTQTPSPWTQSADRVTLPQAGISFPSRPAGVSITKVLEFSAPGEGIDAAVQYRSADGAIIATGYLFYPGLPHSGLAALATDNALRSNSPSPITGGEARIVDAAGVPGAAIRMDYGNYRGGNASTAAFLKAGRWLVKLRVSGPEARKADVEAVTTALLNGVRIGNSHKVYPAAPVTVAPCAAGAGQASARMLPDPPASDMTGIAMLGSMDGAGVEAKKKNGAGTTIMPSRVPGSFCRSGLLTVGNAQIAVLRSAASAPEAIDGRTRMLVLLSDAGGTLELVETAQAKRFLLLHHQVGGTDILSSWDGVPSDAQVQGFLTGSDEAATRTRASIRLRPGKGNEINVAAPPRPKPTT
jgi:hypothetical protein